jgi:hypothetical protein
MCAVAEVAVLLKREAGGTHEQLHEHFAAYERGEEISCPLTLESDEAIKTRYLLRRRADHLGEERCPRNLHLRADCKLL